MVIYILQVIYIGALLGLVWVTLDVEWDTLTEDENDRLSQYDFIYRDWSGRFRKK